MYLFTFVSVSRNNFLVNMQRSLLVIYRAEGYMSFKCQKWDLLWYETIINFHFYRDSWNYRLHRHDVTSPIIAITACAIFASGYWAYGSSMVWCVRGKVSGCTIQKLKSSNQQWENSKTAKEITSSLLTKEDKTTVQK